jgi:signal peptidase I
MVKTTHRKQRPAMFLSLVEYFLNNALSLSDIIVLSITSNRYFYGKKIVATKKRSPILATLLSIVSPGLGQMYNGQLVKGIIFSLIGYLLLLLVSLTRLQFNFYGLIFILGLLVCILLFIVGDALIVAMKKKEIVLKPSNRWYFYVLFAVLAFGISEISDIFVKVEPFGGIKSYKFPSGSMMPTLLIGDHIIVNQDPYDMGRIKRGDIIVFKYPEDPRKDFLKRVIATEGDVIEGKNKKIFVNGKEITELYIQHSDNIIRTSRNDPRDNFGPLTLPKDKLFMMGDNRDQSYDSRYWGFIDMRDIKGKALYIYWSWDPVSESVRWNRIGKNIG